jgi:hypothetical protein
MDHIDEHTLELFVLGSENVRADEERIRAHLEFCRGCRDLVEQMRESFGLVEMAVLEFGERPHAPGPVQRTAAVGLNDGGAPARGYRPVTRWERSRYFVRRHPVVAGAGAFSALALAALLVLQLPDQAARALRNPIQVRANGATGALEAFGADHRRLWELPAEGMGDLADLENRGLKHSSAVDLDGDGRNEVVTVVPVIGSGSSGRKPLLVYSADARLEHSLVVERGVRYGGREYAGPFNAGMLAAGPFGASGTQEVIVRVDNGRSPAAIVRYSGSGENLGEYWHYGVIHAVYSADVNGDGRPEAIIAGQNDVGEERGDTARFAFLAVLDVSRIRGRTASLCSRGFDLPPSEAEILYMRFPQTDMNLALETGAFIHRMQISGAGDSLRFVAWFRGAVESPGVLLIEYRLAADFSCVGVHSTDQTDRLRSGLHTAGRVVGRLDGSYLERLRLGIRYFGKSGWGTQAGWMAPPA